MRLGFYMESGDMDAMVEFYKPLLLDKEHSL